MTIPEETLMAYADGEVDASTRESVERALREDPEVSRRLERHRVLRQRLQAGFAAELSEPVPERLLALVRDSSSAARSNVVNLREAQAARARAAAARASAVASGAAPSARAAALKRAAPVLAAGVLLGLGIGYGAWRQSALPIGRNGAGMLIASGALDTALSRQLTGEATRESAVRIGMSFVAKSGEYCRSFTFGASATSGLACRRAAEWQIQALTEDGAAHTDGYRPAATAWSPLIVKMIQDDIQGEPLDANAESTAREHRWLSPK